MGTSGVLAAAIAAAFCLCARARSVDFSRQVRQGGASVDSCLCNADERGCTLDARHGHWSACGTTAARLRSDGTRCYCDANCAGTSVGCCPDAGPVCLDTVVPSAAPTPAPTTSAPTVQCTDRTPYGVAWSHGITVDVEGSTVGCDAYGGPECALTGDNSWPRMSGGLTANQACCVCGGGNLEGAVESIVSTLAPTPQPTEAPSPLSAQPTPTPTSRPTAASDGCRDYTTPEGEPWRHALDIATMNFFECSNYRATECSVVGDTVWPNTNIVRDGVGMTAGVACCVCGGGYRTESPTWSPTMSPTALPTESPASSTPSAFPTVSPTTSPPTMAPTPVTCEATEQLVCHGVGAAGGQTVDPDITVTYYLEAACREVEEEDEESSGSGYTDPKVMLPSVRDALLDAIEIMTARDGTLHWLYADARCLPDFTVTVAFVSDTPMPYTVPLPSAGITYNGDAIAIDRYVTTMNTASPIASPSPSPTLAPTPSPTPNPTPSPTTVPTTAGPSSSPASSNPTSAPTTTAPTTAEPTTLQSAAPTPAPTDAPATSRPTGAPATSEPTAPTTAGSTPSAVCADIDSSECSNYDQDVCILDWQTNVCREATCADIWVEDDCTASDKGCEFILGYLCNEIGAVVPCNTFWQETDCPADRCTWPQGGWECRDAPDRVDSTTQLPVNPTQDGGGSVVCADIDSSECSNNGLDVCILDWQTNVCRDTTCADIWNEDDCTPSGAGCEWLPNHFFCNEIGVPVPCSAFWQETDCPADRCTWPQGGWECRDAPDRVDSTTQLPADTTQPPKRNRRSRRGQGTASEFFAAVVQKLQTETRRYRRQETQECSCEVYSTTTTTTDTTTTTTTTITTSTTTSTDTTTTTGTTSTTGTTTTTVLPSPDQISVEVVAGWKLTLDGDFAAAFPLIGNAVPITVTGYYRVGTPYNFTRDLTDDDRVSCSSEVLMCHRTQGYGMVVSINLTSGSPVGANHDVHVHLDGYGVRRSQTVRIPIVTVIAARLSAVAHPHPCSGNAPDLTTVDDPDRVVLYRIGPTGPFQRIELRPYVVLSDGSVVHGPEELMNAGSVEWTGDAASQSFMCFAIDGDAVVAQGCTSGQSGSVQLTWDLVVGQFRYTSATSLVVDLRQDAQHPALSVVELTLSYPLVVLSGVPGAQMEPLNVDVRLSNGLCVPNAHMEFPGLVHFSSNEVDAIAVNVITGALTLVGGHYNPVTITATGGGVSLSFDVRADLTPVHGDFDFVAVTGGDQYSPTIIIAPGQQQVSVAVMLGLNRRSSLTALKTMIEFSTDQLSVIDVEIGAGLLAKDLICEAVESRICHKTFMFTEQTAGQLVIGGMLSEQYSSNVAFENIHLYTVTFAIGDGVRGGDIIHLGGQSLELLGTAGTTYPAQPQAFVAGSIDIAVGGSRRRSTVSQRARRQLPNFPDIAPDDRQVTLHEAVQTYRTIVLNQAHSEAADMDWNRDGAIDIMDVIYLIGIDMDVYRVLSGVVSYDPVPAPIAGVQGGSCLLSLSADVLTSSMGPASSENTRVFFLIENATEAQLTPMVTNQQIARGLLVKTPAGLSVLDGGQLIEGSAGPAGTFTAAMQAASSEVVPFGVSVLVVTATSPRSVTSYPPQPDVDNWILFATKSDVGPHVRTALTFDSGQEAAELPRRDAFAYFEQTVSSENCRAGVATCPSRPCLNGCVCTADQTCSSVSGFTGGFCETRITTTVSPTPAPSPSPTMAPSTTEPTTATPTTAAPTTAAPTSAAPTLPSNNGPFSPVDPDAAATTTSNDDATASTNTWIVLVAILVLLLGAGLAIAYYYKLQGSADLAAVNSAPSVDWAEKDPESVNVIQAAPTAEVTNFNFSGPTAIKAATPTEQKEHLLRQLTDSAEGEFKSLAKTKGSATFNTADAVDAGKSPHETLNRYRDVRAYDDTRARLLDGTGNDYINANHVVARVGGAEYWYIGSQGPKSNTVADFWHLVWEQKSQLVVMVTGEVEQGVPKCERYWPPSVGSIYPYKDIQVRLENVMENAAYTLRKLKVWNKKTQGIESARFVFQMQFTSWPDHGVPESPKHMLTFLDEARTIRSHLYPDSDNGMEAPVVVHCSAGIGRTGVFMMIEIALAKLEAGQLPDMHEQLEELREQRYGLVQTLPQYKFIYETLLAALEVSSSRK